MKIKQRWAGVVFGMAGSAAALTGCATTNEEQRAKASSVAGVPRVELLEAAAGWRAEVVLDVGEVGIWAVMAAQILPQYAAPEVIALDDRGRCHVVVGYSGRWGPRVVSHNGSWLGAFAFGRVDGSDPRPQAYVGAQSGGVYQVRGHSDGVVDARRVAKIDGHQVHTLVAADLGPARDGLELLAFTEPGALFLIEPAAPDFQVRRLGRHPGRVRDAVVLPGRRADGGQRLAVVSRAGTLEELVELTPEPRFEERFRLSSGLGRIALGPGASEQAFVLYTAADDGRVHRHAVVAGEAWESELIYAGPQGPRGIAAGRFHADPERESVAVFGYGTRVELLTRPVGGEGPWQVETIFEDRGAGHWLAAAELDGRNATDELLLSGFGGRVVLLARDVGYGFDGVRSDPRPDVRAR